MDMCLYMCVPCVPCVHVCPSICMYNTYPKQKWNVPDVWDIVDVENITSLKIAQQSYAHKISNQSWKHYSIQK